MPRRLAYVLIAVCTLAAAGVAGSAPSVAPVGPPTSTGTGGGAATVERLATEAAIATLRTGGNAVDAAVTAAGVLGVTEPFSCGIGGGGFMVIYEPGRTGKHPHVYTIDSREKAPAAMTPTSFMENGAPLAFNNARYSGLSVGVPGTVRAWTEALRKFGTITLAQALAPGARIARNGFEVDATFNDQINQNLDYFNDVPATAALYLDPDGTALDIGSTFHNPDLANTYDLLGRGGANAFYGGPIAGAIVQASTHPQLAANANHTFRPGVMTTADLATYSAPQRAPTRVSYRGLDVFSMGPPSSGGSTVGEALNILEGYPLSTYTREHALHLYLEASRYAFADRGAYVGDPDFVKVPLRGLLSKDFALVRRNAITDRAALSPVAPGDPLPFNGSSALRGQASVTQTQPGTTTHITTSDKAGNVVSYTFTIESTGGSALVVPGYGFLLNNELTDFNYDSATHPNRVEGGKRPRSSIAPTIVLEKGKPLLAVGSPGGSTIITTVLQILVDRLDLGLSLPQAIADPRVSQRNGTTSSPEAAFLQTPEAAALRARGQAFGAPAEIGAATGIEFLAGNRLLVAAEPVRRGGGSALVVKPTG
ncbi:MAG TPA: gamma-glutamyltransferase [Microbacteriaceae bacterium]|nr:gamma-glutamyltransferase [Microbacteriaceae bacterium]